MSQITSILDACSVINLIHIDEEEFLTKKLKHLNVFLSERVFTEVTTNVFNKFKNKNLYKGENLDVKKEKKTIDQTLSLFRSFQIRDSDILKDMNFDYFEKVKDMTKYTKDNGEFYSTALALYLSRREPTKLLFHTDDYPAKQKFSSFFSFHQIGYIEDTADLLLLIYRLDDNFSKKELDRVLSSLYSEYATEVALLEKEIRAYAYPKPKKLLRDKEFSQQSSKLIRSLSSLNFEGINALKDFFLRKRKYGPFNDILKRYDKVFDLESNSTNLLTKIVDLRKAIKEEAPYKL